MKRFPIRLSTQSRLITAGFLALWCVLACSACGRKGTLVPPEALVPAAVTDLTVAQKGARFLLSWTPPTRQTGGGALKEPTGFALYRRLVLPAGEDCEECPNAYRLLRDSAPGQGAGVRTVGGRYFLDDADLAAGMTYQYKVVFFKGDHAAGPPSNKPRRAFRTPPAPPVLAVKPHGTAIELSWSVPVVTGKLAGFNLYRWRQGDPMPLQALNPAILAEPRYEDLQLDRKLVYHYAVRTVALLDGETVESSLSNEVAAALAEQE